MLSSRQITSRAVERFVDRIDRWQWIDMDGDPPARLFEQLPIGVREQENRFLRVIDPGVGEIGLVVGDEKDGVLAGDVAGR